MPVATDIVFARERVRDLWPELLPLMQAHHDERSADGELPAAIDVDQRQYEVADALATHRAFTARSDGALVGYASFFVVADLHHRTHVRAVHDALFVHPAYRAGLGGAQLILYAERMLRSEGIPAVHQVAPAGSALERALTQLGYVPYEITYRKRLATSPED